MTSLAARPASWLGWTCIAALVLALCACDSDDSGTASPDGSVGAGGDAGSADAAVAGGSGGSATGGAPAPDAGPRGPVGAECTSELDCTSNFCLDSEFARALVDPEDAENIDIPGGYCAALNCQDNASCGDEAARCVDLEASGINDIPFDACLQSCDPEAAETGCRADHECYCDPDDIITDAEGNNGLCLCLPDLLIELLSGE